MNLQNGKYYTMSDGTVVKAQMEADNSFHCYDATGSEIAKVEAVAHVEGWRPVSVVKFAEAREKLKEKSRAKPRPTFSKPDKKKETKESDKE